MLKWPNGKQWTGCQGVQVCLIEDDEDTGTIVCGLRGNKRFIEGKRVVLFGTPFQVAKVYHGGKRAKLILRESTENKEG